MWPTQLLREQDWVSRHTTYRRLQVDGHWRLVEEIQQTMTATELLEGQETGMPLPAGPIPLHDKQGVMQHRLKQLKLTSFFKLLPPKRRNIQMTIKRYFKKERS